MLRPAILAITLLPTLAAATEGNFLTCTVGAKQLSLSIQDDHIIYRYGPDGKPELVLREPVATVDFQPWAGVGRTDTNTVTFHIDSYSYTVVSSTSYENYRNDIHYHDISIWVERDGKELAILECNEQITSDPLDYLRDAKAAIGQCWNREQEQWSENCAECSRTADGILHRQCLHQTKKQNRVKHHHSNQQNLAHELHSLSNFPYTVKVSQPDTYTTMVEHRPCQR